MGVVKDGLPIGSDRNQINYLAEQMDSFSGGGGSNGFPSFMYDQLTIGHTVGVKESFFGAPYYNGYGSSRLDIHQMVYEAANNLNVPFPTEGSRLNVCLRADFDFVVFFNGNIPANVANMCMRINVRSGYQDNSPIIFSTRFPVQLIDVGNGTNFRVIGGRTFPIDLQFLDSGITCITFDLDWTYTLLNSNDYNYSFGNSESALTIVSGYYLSGSEGSGSEELAPFIDIS